MEGPLQELRDTLMPKSAGCMADKLGLVTGVKSSSKGPCIYLHQEEQQEPGVRCRGAGYLFVDSLGRDV